MDNNPTPPNPTPEGQQPDPTGQPLADLSSSDTTSSQPAFGPASQSPTFDPMSQPSASGPQPTIVPGYGAPQPEGMPPQGFGPQPPIDQPYGPQPSQPYGGPQPGQPKPVVPKKPMDPKTKKTIILICSIVGGVLVLGIAALVVLPIIFKIDYKRTYELSDTASDIRYSMQGSDSCTAVINYVDSSYQSASDYGKYVSKCKSDIESFRKSIDELSTDAGVQRDATIKKEWDKFKPSYDGTIEPYTQLIDIYSAWHTFIADWSDTTEDDDWWTTMNEAKVQSLTAPLTSSSNTKLKEYGSSYVTARWKQISAFQAYRAAYDTYYDSAYNDPNRTALRNDMNSKSEVYNAANAAYNDYVKNEPDISDTESLVGIDIDASDHQFLSKFSDVTNAVSVKYIEQGFKDAIGL